jgi:hypothetical protein
MKLAKNFTFANLKKLFNEENKTTAIGLLTILVLLWLVLYFVPQLFLSLFNTFLGNLIIFTIALVVLMHDIRYGIIVSILFIVIYRFTQLTKYSNTNQISKEGFIWNQQSTQDFLQTQNTINPKVIFDVNLIQEAQASQEELNYFNKNARWPWSEKTKELYIKAIKRNPFVRVSPKSALDYARTIYNEKAILMILSYQTKEGQFLLNGVLVQDPSGNKMEDLPSGFGDYPYLSGLIDNKSDDVIKCNMSKPNGAYLERITYTGKGGIYGEQTSKVTPVDYNNLENIIPGFTFLNTPCNPCGAINQTPDYSCPFKLTVKNKPPFISDVWQTLWNVNDNPLQSMPSFLSENINQKEFPILSELQSELLKQNTYTNTDTNTDIYTNPN